MDRNLALELSDTLRHDGPDGLTADWLAGHLPAAPAGTLPRLRELRGPVRALFAEAVKGVPAPGALDALNAAARVPVVPVLTGGGRLVLSEVDGGDPVAAVARAAMELLSGPERERLRACPAPRCVRYFLREHNRQNYCKTSCGNRARVARHYEKSRATGD